MKKTIGNNLPRIKVTNQFSIREVIYKFGPISRIEIAERLGLTIPTITTNVSLMIEKGLLHEVENPCEKKTLGRKTMLVDFVPDSRLYLGIELRGSFRYVVLADLRGNVLASGDDQTFLPEYSEALENAASLAEKVLAEAAFSKDQISAVGVCAPGLVDASTGTLIIHPGYGWSQKPIAQDFAKAFCYSGTVYADNNAIGRAFALSLFNAHKAKDGNSLAYMYVGTGIACPLLTEVKNHFGVISGEGEVGHMIMNPQGPKCSCGNHGCLEAYSSEKTMVQKAREAVEKGESPVLQSLASDGINPSVQDLMEAKRRGDKVALEIVREAIEYLGLAIANIDNFVRPECVAVESRLFDDPENRKELMEVIHRNLYRETFSDYKFSFIAFDEYSGAKGAAAVAIRHNLEAYIG